MTKKLTTEEYRQIRDWMLKNFPNTFGTLELPRPLACGIGGVIPFHISRNKTRMFFARWTKRFEYRCALAAGGYRFGIDGEPGDAVKPHEQHFARVQIDGLITFLKRKGDVKLAAKLESDWRYTNLPSIAMIPA